MTMKDFESLQKQQEAFIAAAQSQSSSPDKDMKGQPLISADLTQVPIHRGPLAPRVGVGNDTTAEINNTQSKYQKASDNTTKQRPPLNNLKNPPQRQQDHHLTAPQQL